MPTIPTWKPVGFCKRSAKCWFWTPKFWRIWFLRFSHAPQAVKLAQNGQLVAWVSMDWIRSLPFSPDQGLPEKRAPDCQKTWSGNVKNRQTNLDWLISGLSEAEPGYAFWVRKFCRIGQNILITFFEPPEPSYAYHVGAEFTPYHRWEKNWNGWSGP